MAPERPVQQQQTAQSQPEKPVDDPPRAAAAVERYQDMSARLFARCADVHPFASSSAQERRIIRLVPVGLKNNPFITHVYELITRPQRIEVADSLVGAVATDLHVTKIGIYGAEVVGLYAEWLQRYNERTGKPIRESHAIGEKIDLEGERLLQTVDRLWGDVQAFTPDVTAAEIETATTALNALYEEGVAARQLAPNFDISPETLYLP